MDFSLQRNYLAKSSSGRGRPRSVKHYGPTTQIINKKVAEGIEESMPMTCLSSFYSMKKLSEQEYEAAKFYEEVSYGAFKKSECSVLKNSSFMANLSNGSSVKTFDRSTNHKDLKKWTRLRSMLTAHSHEVEQIVYNFLIHNKAVSFHELPKLKTGLALIYNYCSKNHEKLA